MKYSLVIRCCFMLLLLLPGAEVLSGPPFKTDDPEPVEYLHWEFYIASVQQFGNNESNATLPHIEVNYGVAPNMQLHLVAPLNYIHTVDGTHYGYGDTEIGVKFRFAGETAQSPQIGVFPLLEIPTGNTDLQLGTGETQAYFPVWIQKSWGNLTSYGGSGYWYNPGAGNKNWIFSGWEVQYDFSSAVTIGGEYYFQTANTEDSQSSSGFNIGGFINIDQHDHILFSLGRLFLEGNVATGYIAYQLTI